MSTKPQRGNKEAKKPKQAKVPAPPPGSGTPLAAIAVPERNKRK